MIHLIFTGGTISMQRDAAAGGKVPTLDGKDLVSLAPGLRDLAPLEIDDWGRFPACHMDQAKLWELREHVRRVATVSKAAVPPSGIVITHGTDTIEETGYLLARTLDLKLPIVITGAMLTSGDPGWDGPRNLTDAVRVASNAGSKERGVLVAFAGQVFAAHQAVKTHTSDLDAFSAPHAAALGTVSAAGVEYQAAAAKPKAVTPPGLTARVAMIPVITGDNGELLDRAFPSFDGVVVVGYGTGNCPPGILPAVRRWLDAGKPVVLASRCIRGEVSATYAFPGAGGDLIRMGVLPAGPRAPSQARMELAICLSAGVSYGVRE
ncbi:MAG TPA: asparaginase [Gemmatimonadales bacterium]|jgi:L-asparaginase